MFQVAVFVGDAFEGHSTPSSDLLAELRHLSVPLRVWGVLGNHEFHAISQDNVSYFEAAGIHLLRNTWVGASRLGDWRRG